MPGARRKVRTREHIIADLAINHVERQVLLCGYSVERIEHDYGIDLVTFHLHSDRRDRKRPGVRAGESDGANEPRHRRERQG
jgi:hypothetical protein